MTKLLCALVLLPALLSASEIPLVGIDGDGRPIERPIPVESYVHRMGKLLAAAQDSAMPALYEMQWQAPLPSPSKRKWRLRTFTLGVGLNLSVGVGKILSFSIAPAFTLVMSNSKDPIIP